METNKVIETTLVGLGSRICYHIMAGQDPAKHGGYVPSLMVRGRRGHCPMLGRGDLSRPWVWGQTLEEAEAACDSYNRKQLGLDSDSIHEIILSTM